MASDPFGDCRWRFPDPAEVSTGRELLGIGADLQPETMARAYSSGIFPMPVTELPEAPIGWFSADPRAVFIDGSIHVSRSLRRQMRAFRLTLDEAFLAVVEACAEPARPNGWIDDRMIEAYFRLHELGVAHSVEVWEASGDRLVGGIFGLEFGGLFAAESMFHRLSNASKAALVGLGSIVFAGDHSDLRLIDAQWPTAHLISMGAVQVSRGEYLSRIGPALQLPPRFRVDATGVASGAPPGQPRPATRIPPS